MFLFSSNKSNSKILERNAGPCTYGCNNGTVQKVERTLQTFLCGCIPTPEHTETIMQCSQCRRIVRAAYYTGNNGKAKGFDTVADARAGLRDTKKKENVPVIAATKIDR